MKIAVTYGDGQVFQHFGHTEQFKLYTVADGKVSASVVVNTDGEGHGALSNFLMKRKVDVLICGGIGVEAHTALDVAGIKLYPGVSGSADGAVRALLDGSLSFKQGELCKHHSEQHGHRHNCVEHGCSEHHGENHGRDCGCHS